MKETPHDALFKFAFSEVDTARAELEAVLPSALVARIDWSTLRSEPTSTVDERLRTRHSDLVFSVDCDGHRAFIYVLLEHQSEPDALMPYRVLVYIVRLWEQFLKNNPDAKRLPAVLPVVVHHGEGGWTNPVAFEDLIDAEHEMLAAILPFVPRFRFLLDDLARVDEEALRQRAISALGEAALLLLQNARRRTWQELRADLVRWMATLACVATARNGPAALWALMRYILLVAEPEPQELLEYVRSFGPAAEEAFMTGAEKLRKEGEIRGVAKGRAEGRAELLVKQLTLRFGTLSDDVVRRVRSATVDELDQFAERVLTAATLEDVLG